MNRPPLNPSLISSPELAFITKQSAIEHRKNDSLRAIILGLVVFAIIGGAIDLAMYFDEKRSQAESTE